MPCLHIWRCWSSSATCADGRSRLHESDNSLGMWLNSSRCSLFHNLLADTQGDRLWRIASTWCTVYGSSRLRQKHLQYIEDMHLKWYRRVRRMSDDRLPCKLLNWKPTTNKSPGLPRKRWMDNVKWRTEGVHWLMWSWPTCIWTQSCDGTKQTGLEPFCNRGTRIESYLKWRRQIVSVSLSMHDQRMRLLMLLR